MVKCAALTCRKSNVSEGLCRWRRAGCYSEDTSALNSQLINCFDTILQLSRRKFGSQQSSEVKKMENKSLQTSSGRGRTALTNAPRELVSLMPARYSTSCLTLCHKHTLKHTLTPLLSSFHLLLYIINMESRNIRVNSSDTLIKAAKSIGLNWYSWRLSSQELPLPTGRRKDPERRCWTAVIMCAKSEPLNSSSSTEEVFHPVGEQCIHFYENFCCGCIYMAAICSCKHLPFKVTKISHVQICLRLHIS